MKVADALKLLVDRLATWRGTEQLGAREVLVWPTGKGQQIAIAFRGDALRFETRLLRGWMRNPRASRDTWLGVLDVGLCRALGIEETQLFPQDEVYAQDFLAGVETAAAEFLGIDGDNVYATLMPLEGEPWSPRLPKTEFVSSRSGKALTSKGPPPLVKLDLDQSTAITQGITEPVGVDVCAVAPKITDCAAGAVVAAVGELELLVTHCFDPRFERLEGAASLIKRCGGLAMPSLAVGTVPATSFGQVVLVADVALALLGLAPYKRRGKWPIVVYETDSWTATTKQVFLVGAHELYRELTGQDNNWTYKNHFWTLGVPIEDDRAKLIPSTSKLLAAVKRRNRPWKRELDAAGVERVKYAAGESKERYPYLEAKANGIVTMSCFPLALCPAVQKAQAQSFLRAAGWKGKLLTLDCPVYPDSGNVVDGRDVWWDYAWLVRDAVLGYARKDARRTLEVKP